jgi:hypothetical protein
MVARAEPGGATDVAPSHPLAWTVPAPGQAFAASTGPVENSPASASVSSRWRVMKTSFAGHWHGEAVGSAARARLV